MLEKNEFIEIFMGSQEGIIIITTGVNFTNISWPTVLHESYSWCFFVLEAWLFWCKKIVRKAALAGEIDYSSRCGLIVFILFRPGFSFQLWEPAYLILNSFFDI